MPSLNNFMVSNSCLFLWNSPNPSGGYSSIIPPSIGGYSSIIPPSIRSMMSSPNSDWADLPMELLGYILLPLPFTDHIRLSSVCASWRSIINRRIFPPRPQSPCLLLPAWSRDPESIKLHCPSERRSYTIPLPLPPIRSRVCIGSSHGWLVTLSGASMSDVHLLNPLTRVQIPLPSLTPLFSYFPQSPLRDHIQAAKAILSSPPSSGDNNGFTVVIIYRLSSRLAFFRPGDSSWTAVAEDEDLQKFSDVIYRNGRLHTVDFLSSVCVWDDDFRPAFKKDFKQLGCQRNYLVESPTGELFMVHRRDGPLRTIDIRVTRLDIEAEKWEDVQDFADSALFVGCNFSMSISALEFPEFSGNCLYFTKDIYCNSHRDRKDSREAGVFDLKKNKFKWLDSSNPEFNWPSSIWFTPTFAV